MKRFGLTWAEAGILFAISSLVAAAPGMDSCISLARAEVVLKNGESTIGNVQTLGCGTSMSCSRAGSTGTISCIPASGVAGGCLTAGSQTIAGAKTWNGDQTAMAQMDLRGNTVIRGQVFFLASGGGIFVADDQNLPIGFTDSVAAGSATAGFTVQSGNARTAGPLFRIRNGIVEALSVDWQGNVFSGCGANPDGGQALCGSFIDNSSVSGHTSLTVSPGLYVSIVGQNAYRYWAEHGAITVANANPMMAGYTLELEAVDVSYWGGYSEVAGARTNKKLMVNYQGGVHWGGAYSLSQFAPCGNYENHPVNDGGSELLDGGDSYYTATDGGVAQEGTLQWATDKQDLYLCIVPGNAVLPNGEWWPLHISSTLPSLGQATIGGGGTVTKTVLAGQHCQCTYNNGGTAALNCSVSSTTLTITGTATAVVNYRCDT